jgi:DNA-binding transcriptional LysR family regulator
MTAMSNLRSLDLNLLTVFEAIYEHGTVRGAAGRLMLSKSATSHALSRLREEWRDELFVRAGPGLSPTPVATAMYPAIKQALETVRASLGEVAGFDPSRSRRRFRISIPHPMGPFYALHLLEAAAATAPGIELTFNTVSRPADLEDELRNGGVELAVDWVPAELDPFINTKLFDDRLMLITRTNHPITHAGVRMEDLRQAKFVAPHRRRPTEELPQALNEFYKAGFKEAVRVSELLEIPTVVANTELLGVFPSSMGFFMAKQLGIVVLPLPFELPALPIFMIWHESRRNDAAHRWLRELVVAGVGHFAKG